MMLYRYSRARSKAKENETRDFGKKADFKNKAVKI
jgi:hypothetical protein